MSERAELIIDTQLDKSKKDFQELEDINKQFADGLDKTKARIGSVEIELNKLGNTAKSQVLSALRDVEKQANATTDALTKAAKAGGGAIGGDVQLTSQQRQERQLGASLSQLLQGDKQSGGALLAKFDDAARNINDEGEVAKRAKGLKELSDGSKVAAKDMDRLKDSANELKNTLKQGLGRGSFLADLLDIGGAVGGGGPFAVAAAGLLALGALAIQKAQEVREKAESELKKLQQTVNAGLTGDFKKRETELERLRDVQKELKERIALGDTQAQQDVFGRDENKGIETISNLELLIKKAEENQRKIELIRFNTARDGDDNNIFAQARKSLMALAQETNSVDYVEKRLLELKKLFEKGDIKNVEEYKREIANLNAELKNTAESMKFAEQKKQEFQRETQFRNQMFQEARGGFDELGSRLGGDNQFFGIFEAGQKRMETFRLNFAGVSDEIVARATEMNNRVMALEMFKAELAGRGRIEELLLRDANTRFAQREAELSRQFDSRGGLSTPEALERESLLKQIRAMQGTDSYSAVTHANLIRQMELADFRASRGAKERELAERALADLPNQLDKFALNSPERRAAESAAIDMVLASIGRIDPSRLPSNLLDAQTKLIERRSQLESTAREDAKRLMVEQFNLLSEIQRIIKGLPETMKQSVIIELRDRTAQGTFDVTRMGGTSLEEG